jgi:hypothetical protein
MIEQVSNLLPLLVPIIILELAFRIYAIVDILNEARRVKGENKIIWILVVALVNFGWVVYFLFGREE